jgi:hypothetical protein
LFGSWEFIISNKNLDKELIISTSHLTSGWGEGERRGNNAIKAICFRIFYCTIKEEKSQLLKKC